MKCRHCNFRVANNRKHLCGTCYRTTGVRGLYPNEYKTATLLAHNNVEPPYPVPTKELPGSAEKVDVFVARASAGEQMFHPDDAKHIGCH